MSTSYRKMSSADLDEAIELWKNSQGIGLSAADSVEHLEQFLRRNPGFSYVAIEDSCLVGAVLCGHDGRRGYLHHLAVAESHQRGGIGRQLVEICMKALRTNGIMKCHLFIFTDNQAGLEFWRRIGWTHRDDLAMMSAWTSPEGQKPDSSS
ncbi:MAG TPA: GNAT family N-acetyltransferase [candidate division Zixibacteria bacterium]|nr:GNAT family N-acetyltransferase [candidate division Zixibacteria bacterium]